MDPGYFIDLLTIGPLFRLLSGSVPPNQVFGAFGNAFEDYARAILERTYPSTFGVKRLFIGVQSRETDPEFEIDALLNEGPAVVVMEVKAAFIAESAILADDPAEFIRVLEKKYAVAEGQQDREVGVAQLAKSIRAIVLDKWDGAQIDRSQLKRIFPVLVVHDDRLSSPGCGAILNERFHACLGDISASKVRVENLTIMTIHDLENKESSDGFSMTELLSAYVAEASGGMVSLHNFMARDSRFNAKVRPSETLIRESAAEIEELRKRLFSDPAADATEGAQG
jgi:hypothetical protein